MRRRRILIERWVYLIGLPRILEDPEKSPAASSGLPESHVTRPSTFSLRQHHHQVWQQAETTSRAGFGPATDVQDKVGSATGGHHSRTCSRVKERTFMLAALTKTHIDLVGHVGQTGATYTATCLLTRERCCFHLIGRTDPIKCTTSAAGDTNPTILRTVACGVMSKDVRTGTPESHWRCEIWTECGRISDSSIMTLGRAMKPVGANITYSAQIPGAVHNRSVSNQSEHTRDVESWWVGGTGVHRIRTHSSNCFA